MIWFELVWLSQGFHWEWPSVVHSLRSPVSAYLHTHLVPIHSSMGGTDPSNFLNSIGKNPDGTGNGDILLWKRKAERYLVEVREQELLLPSWFVLESTRCSVKRCSCTHTRALLSMFLSPSLSPPSFSYQSGLAYTIIHPGGLVDTEPGLEEFVLDVDDKLIKNEKRSISRADVAKLCVAALVEGKGTNVSFDCITREGTPVSAGEALQAFLATGKTANYDL